MDLLLLDTQLAYTGAPHRTSEKGTSKCYLAVLTSSTGLLNRQVSEAKEKHLYHNKPKMFLWPPKCLLELVQRSERVFVLSEE